MQWRICLVFLPILLFYSSLNQATPTAHTISFATADNGKVFADFYPAGDKSIILAHGAVFNKESWDPLINALIDQNISVLAIDFRGYGQSTAGKNSNALYLDILAAIQFLHQQSGIKTISVLGASMGGAASAQAASKARPGSIDKLILLSPAQVTQPQKLTGNILYIASKNEVLSQKIKTWFEQSPKPKQLIWIKGKAHAQHIFKTDQATHLVQTILQFINK